MPLTNNFELIKRIPYQQVFSHLVDDPHVLVDVGEAFAAEVADGLQLEMDHPGVLVQVTSVTITQNLNYIICFSNNVL